MKNNYEPNIGMSNIHNLRCICEKLQEVEQIIGNLEFVEAMQLQLRLEPLINYAWNVLGEAEKNEATKWQMKQKSTK